MMTTAVNKRKSQKGLATLEAIPLLAVFIMLVGYSLGLFGAIHTAILHSIGARTYAFETFRNRTNLKIFRENSAGDIMTFAKFGVRFHGIIAEGAVDSDNWLVPTRPLSIGYSPPSVDAKPEDHLVKIFELDARNQKVAVGPIWVMVNYGMCLEATCGDR
jgi:hypothetical protein